MGAFEPLYLLEEASSLWEVLDLFLGGTSLWEVLNLFMGGFSLWDVSSLWEVLDLFMGGFLIVGGFELLYGKLLMPHPNWFTCFLKISQQDPVPAPCSSNLQTFLLYLAGFNRTCSLLVFDLS